MSTDPSTEATRLAHFLRALADAVQHGGSAQQAVDALLKLRPDSDDGKTADTAPWLTTVVQDVSTGAMALPELRALLTRLTHEGRREIIARLLSRVIGFLGVDVAPAQIVLHPDDPGHVLLATDLALALRDHSRGWMGRTLRDGIEIGPSRAAHGMLVATLRDHGLVLWLEPTARSAINPDGLPRAFIRRAAAQPDHSHADPAGGHTPPAPKPASTVPDHGTRVYHASHPSDGTSGPASFIAQHGPTDPPRYRSIHVYLDTIGTPCPNAHGQHVGHGWCSHCERMIVTEREALEALKWAEGLSRLDLDTPHGMSRANDPTLPDVQLSPVWPSKKDLDYLSEWVSERAGCAEDRRARNTVRRLIQQAYAARSPAPKK